MVLGLLYYCIIAGVSAFGLLAAPSLKSPVCSGHPSIPFASVFSSIFWQPSVLPLCLPPSPPFDLAFSVSSFVVSCLRRA